MSLDLSANLDGLGDPAGLSRALTFALEDLLNIEDIADTDSTSVSAGNGVDTNTGVPLGSLALVNATNALKSLLRLELVLVSGGGVDIGHIAAGAAAGEVVSQSVDVDQAPLILLEGLGDARDDKVGTEVQGSDGFFQVGVDVRDRLLRQAQDGEIVCERGLMI